MELHDGIYEPCFLQTLQKFPDFQIRQMNHTGQYTQQIKNYQDFFFTNTIRLGVLMG